MFADIQSTALTAVGTGMLVASGVVWSITRPSSPTILKGIDYSCHSVPVNEEKFTRTSQFKRLAEVKRGDCRNIQTLYEIFQCGMYHGKDKPCLGYKPEGSNEYQWLSYTEVDKLSLMTGAGIIHRLNQSAGQSTRLGLYMRNNVEWVYVEQACSRYSMVPVPLYDTLGEESCFFILKNVKCQVIIIDCQKKLDFLFESHGQLPTLKYVVCTYAVSRAMVDQGGQYGLDVLEFSEILKAGQDHPHPTMICKPDDICTIFFTSGTTGDPKGCATTHSALLNNLSGALMLLEATKFGKKQEVHLSILPLSHVYERLAHILMFFISGKIAFFSGDIRTLVDEWKAIRPTIIITVPRLLNRIYDKVMSQMNKSKLAKLIYNKGLCAKMEEVRLGVIRKNSPWDYLLFKKIQALLGGRADIILVGSAPISGNVLNFCRAVLGSLVLEGYGQTETAGPVCLTLPGDYISGQVGPPFPGVIMKLCDVPELDIIVARDFRGEVCVKGPPCITSYFEDEEMTNKLIDSDKWLHTGDVGEWTEKGQLRIVDRCKHIFKLAQGEYLAPEKLENVYVLSTLVAQIFVTGNSLKDYCVAVVVPELDGWRELGREYESLGEICDDQDSVPILLKNLEATGRQHKLMGFEIVKKVFMWPQLLTIENGFMTPTMKLKRNEVTKFFKKRTDLLYLS